MMKLMIVGRRRGGMTLAQLHRYMTDVHGATVVRLIGEQPELTPRRYVQNHVFDGTFRLAGSQPDPFSLGRDFVTQVWFDNPAQAQASIEAPFYLSDLRPDEDRFVDQSSVVKYPVAEQQLFGSAAPVARRKLFVFLRRGLATSGDELSAASSAAWAALLARPGHAIDRLVRNTVMTGASQRASVDLVDEAWLHDNAAAEAVAGHWQALVDSPAIGKLLVPGSTFMLLAREQVLFAGRPG